MQIRIFVLTLLLLGMGSWSVLAQPCNEYPNPIIQTDFEAYCQGSPQGGVIPTGPAPEASVPVFTLGDCSIVCENSPVAYTVPNADPTHQFYWEAFGTAPGSPATGTGASFSAQWGGVGIGLIRVTETTPDNCATSVEQCIEIIASPEADFTTLPPALSTGLTVCNGTTVPFFDQSQGDVITWSWDFGDGTYSSDPNPSHVFRTNTQTQTYLVTLTVFNDCGCSDTKTLSVTVEPTAAPIISCVSTVCEGETVDYVVTNAATCTGATFNWTAQGGRVVQVTGNEVSVIWDNPINGQGFLSVDVSNCPGVCNRLTTVTVPILTSGRTLTGPDVVCIGDLVQYQLTPQPGARYNWGGSAQPYFFSEPNDHSIDVRWTDAGTYQICGWVSANSSVATGNLAACAFPRVTYCKTVTVKTAFEVTANFLPTICSSDSRTFCTRPLINNTTWIARNANGSVVTLSLPLGACVNIPGSSLPPGTYEIRASTSSTAYCNQSASMFLTILEDAPLLTATDLTGPLDVCPGSSYDYAVQVNGGYYAEWNAVGGTVRGRGEEVTISWDDPTPAGGYAIELTQRGMAEPSCPSTTVFPVSPISPVVPTVSGPSLVCVDAEASYSASGLAQVTELEWEVAPSSRASIVAGQNTASPTLQFNQAAGVVQLRLHYTICNTVYTTTYPITVTGAPVVQVVIPAEACQEESLSLSASLSFAPGGVVTWTWDFGDGNTTTSTGAASTVAHTYTQSGTFPVQVRATYNGTICAGSSQSSQLLNVKPIPLVNITSTNGTNLCPSSPTTNLVASLRSVPGTGSVYSYRWLRGGVTQGTTPTLLVSQTGRYFLEVEDPVLACVAREFIDVTSICNLATCTGSLDFNVPTAACDPLVFQAIASSNYSNFRWSFGDQQVASGATVSHTYTSSGFYNITLAATDNNSGQTCTVTKQLILPFVPNFAAEFSCPGNAIEVQLLNQTDYLPGAVLTYGWTWPGGSSSVANPLIANLLPGPQNISLFVTDGTVSCSLSQTITVPTPVDAHFVANDPQCEGNVMTFTNQSGPLLSDVVAANWDFGDGSGSNLIDAERTYTHAVSGNNPVVRLTVTDAWGCTDTYAQSVTVHRNELTGNVTVDPAGPACPTPPLRLTATIPAGTLQSSYQWSGNDGTQPLGSNTQSDPIPRTGEYVVEVRDALGCVERSPAETVIITRPPRARISGVRELCEGEIIELSAFQSFDYSYVWSEVFPDGSSRLRFSPDITTLASDVGVHRYRVTLTDNVTTCSHTSDWVTVTVHPGPQDLAVVSTGSNCTPANLQASVSGPSGVDYVWSNGDTGPTALVQGGGSVEVTAYTPEGCSDHDFIDIGEGPDLTDIATGCYCFPYAVTWLAPQGAGYTYAWYTDGVSSPISTNSYLPISVSGIYRVVVTGPNGCSSESDPILIDIGSGCGACDLSILSESIECIGRDDLTGEYLYAFSLDILNNGANLAGWSAVSTLGTITNLSPTALPGNGQQTTVTGVFRTAFPFATAVRIEFRGAGTDGAACAVEWQLDQLPPCEPVDCDVTWYEPSMTCLGDMDGYVYYSVVFTATNFGSTLPNLRFQPCAFPDVSISYPIANLDGISSSIIPTVMRVRQGISNDCIQICADDPSSENGECCWVLDLSFPENCPSWEECEWAAPKQLALKCGQPAVDVSGNRRYDFTIDLATYIAGGNASLLPWHTQTGDRIEGLQVSVSGNDYLLTGTLIDTPPFSGVEQCFRVFVYDEAGQVCWLKVCMERPDCSGGGNEDPTFRRSTSDVEPVVALRVSPNPAQAEVRVEVVGARAAPVELRLMNVMGQHLRWFSGVRLGRALPLDLADLPEGLYLLQVWRDGRLLSQEQLVVVR